MAVKHIIRGIRRRLRGWGRVLSRPLRTVRRRWEVCRLRALPGVEFLVVIDPASPDPVSRAVRDGWNPDEAGMELMRQFVGRGDRVLDLGGHVGLFALAAAALGCEVLTVEASQHNAGLLAASARLNGFANLHVVNCAVGAAPGLVAFCEAGPFGSVASSRVRRPVTSRVPVLSAEALLAGMGWDRLAFVKMDVEGSEVAALAGLRRFLEPARAPAVLFESNDHTLNFFGQTPEALHAAFAAAGYRCYQVGARRLTACSPGDFQGPTTVDYLAVKAALPPLPAGWEVAAGFTEAELIGQLHAALTDANPDERASAARRLARAPARLLVSPALQAGLRRLHHDGDDGVRGAAAWHARRAA
jgi:FkbM family methyltransferase